MNTNVKLSSYVETEQYKKVEIKNGNVLVLSDLHIPYHIEPLIEEIIDTHNSDYLVIAGDFMDSEHISSLANSRMHIILDELFTANDLIKKWSKRFKQVFLLDGNHERRLSRYVEKHAPEIAFLTPSSLNYFAGRYISLKNGYLEDYGPIENVQYIPDRFFIMNNVLFSHPLNYLSTPGATVRKTIETAVAERLPFDVAIIGHTHKMAMINHMGRVGIENGCLTNYRDYVVKAGILAQPNQIGYSYLQFENYKCVAVSPYNLTYSYYINT
jgi:predicted phosphodiesterase